MFLQFVVQEVVILVTKAQQYYVMHYDRKLIH